jgi:hypothetical protein
VRNTRHRIPGLVVAILTAATSLTALATGGPVLQRIVSKDLPVELPITVKRMGSAAERLGQFAAVPLGVEDSVVPISPTAAVTAPLSLTGMKVEDALESLVHLSSTYEWRQIANVVVIRPTKAWADPDNPLNRRIESVDWRSVNFAEALDRTMSLLTSLEYKTPQPTPDERRFDIVMQRPTLLQLLNTIALEHGQLVWHVGYNNSPTEQFGIGFKTFSGHARWVWTPTLDKRRSTVSSRIN